MVIDPATDSSETLVSFKLNVITSQKTVIFLVIAIRTLNLHTLLLVRTFNSGGACRFHSHLDELCFIILVSTNLRIQRIHVTVLVIKAWGGPQVHDEGHSLHMEIKKLESYEILQRALDFGLKFIQNFGQKPRREETTYKV
jgi:hypothetical protein